MQEAVTQTLQTNPDVLIDVARRLSIEEALKGARGGYSPRVDLTLGGGREKLDNTSNRALYGSAVSQLRYDSSLTLTQMLFDGHATSSEVDRNRARAESSSHKLASTSEQIALKVIEAYLEVLRLQEAYSLTQENVAVHQRTHDQIKLRATSGVGRKSDLDQIEARLALANSNLTSAEANLKIAEINYKLVVGDMPKKLVKPKEPDASLTPTSLEDAIQKALSNNRILNSARADVEAARAQHRASKSPMYPRMDLEVAARHSNVNNISDGFGNDIPGTFDQNQSAMLKMRYNLFSGGTNRASIAETLYLQYEAQEILRRAERQLEQSVRLSWTAYRSAVDKLPSLRKHAESSQLTRDSYVKQFTLGQRTLLDLLDTENEAFTSSANYINGRYVELFSLYRVLADVGTLLDTLGVPHREETMTPP